MIDGYNILPLQNHVANLLGMMMDFTKKCLGALSLVWLMSCINTSYSRLDEVEVTGVEVDLIVGQFAHHGEAFYRHEVKRTKKLLGDNERNYVARNDLASAYIKLKMYAEAEKEFMLNEKHHPGQYETASNFGVLYKKMGKYTLAAENIKMSLEVKPEGHMGLGDYYLRMIEWLEKIEKDPIYDHNFLGIPYSDPAESIRVNKVVSKEYLMTLIKNDYQFADVYFVLGDVFLSERDYQLAIRCYYRALHLDHPREDLCYMRINDVQTIIASMKTEGQVADTRSVSRQIENEFDAAEGWLTKYKELEGRRLSSGQAVDFKTMKGALTAEGIEKPRVVEALLYNGKEESRMWYSQGDAFVVIALVAVILSVVIYFLCKMSRKTDVARPYCLYAMLPVIALRSVVT